MPPSSTPTTPVSRRRFLRLAAMAGGGLAAAGCALPGLLATGPAPTAGIPTAAVAAGEPTVTFTRPPAATRTPFSPPTAAPAPTLPSPTPTAEASYVTWVGIERAASYEPAVVRESLQTLLDGPGGLGDVVRPGARVAVKVNLTGGAAWVRAGGLPPTEVYLTHPEVVRALCELLRDAGAAKIYVVEGVYEPESYPVFGYTGALQPTGAELVDLNWREPFSSFAEVHVGPQALVYDSFTLNPALVEIDAFISVAKLKCHYSAGVTLAMKNLVGISPLGYYRHSAEHNYRSALHGGFQDGVDRRLIRAIIDLNRARPIDYALIDGIWTCEGGEGPWQPGMQQVKPGLLIGGRNPVAVDAVATAVMGFDPAAADRAAPFLRSENYLRLAAEHGLGTHHLDEIGVSGTPIEAARMNFRPTEG